MNPINPQYLAMLTLCLLVTGCAFESESNPATGSTQSSSSKTRHVLVIGIDGARPDALLQASTPNLDKLIENGLWAPAATTQLSSATSSGPGWMSILTGVSPEKHGVIANGFYLLRNTDYKTFVWHAHHTGDLATRVSVTWAELLDDIIEEDAYDRGAVDSDEGTTEKLATSLLTEQHRLIFIHLDAPDHAGHSSGFSADNPDYLEAFTTIDAQVGRLLDAIAGRPTRGDEEWLVAMTTDHGGDSLGHGSLNKECQTIWVILSGDGIKAGEIPTDGTEVVSHMDVFPSVMEYLNIEIEPQWQLEGSSRLQFSD